MAVAYDADGAAPPFDPVQETVKTNAEEPPLPSTRETSLMVIFLTRAASAGVIEVAMRIPSSIATSEIRVMVRMK